MDVAMDRLEDHDGTESEARDVIRKAARDVAPGYGFAGWLWLAQLVIPILIKWWLSRERSDA